MTCRVCARVVTACAVPHRMMSVATAELTTDMLIHTCMRPGEGAGEGAGAGMGEGEGGGGNEGEGEGEGAGEGADEGEGGVRVRVRLVRITMSREEARSEPSDAT